jgi:hypothetical protein
MVGVLADNYNFNLVERAVVEGIENESGGWVYGGSHIFGTHKFGKLDEIVFIKL